MENAKIIILVGLLLHAPNRRINGPPISACGFTALKTSHSHKSCCLFSNQGSDCKKNLTFSSPPLRMMAHSPYQQDLRSPGDFEGPPDYSGSSKMAFYLDAHEVFGRKPLSFRSLSSSVFLS